MQLIQFWKTWSLVNQRLFWFFASLAFAAFVFFWISEFITPSPSIPVQHTQEVQSVSFDGHAFRVGAFRLNVPADAFLVFEKIEGGPLIANATGSYIFLFLLVIGIVGILAIGTTLPRFWLFTLTGLIAIIVLSLRIESVIATGIPDPIASLLLLILYLVPVGYFTFVNTTLSFARRLGVFVIVTAIAALLIYFLSAARQPFLHLAANAIIPGTVVMIVFIFMVAHEPLAALIAVISRGVRQTRSLVHFLIIGTIYLVNLGIIYANRKYIIQWNYLPINIMVFVSLSGILGVWGFRQRDSQFEGIIRANPYGVLFYLCMATIGFGTMGYFFATANDPVIRLAEDCILYSSLGYGIIFMIYVINNFGAMMVKNLQVYRILYQPENMPYFTFRLAGLICTVVFFAYSNWKVSVHQAYAGYYNSAGDYDRATEQGPLAEENYNLAVHYALRNYHAHYALANMRSAAGDLENEIKEYRLLADSRPLDLAYLNLSHLTFGRNSLKASMEILHLALHDFPRNGRIENEMAISYAGLNLKDSAMNMMRLAMRSSLTKKEAAINWIALQAQFKTRRSADSLLRSLDSSDPGIRSNALALACINGTPMAVDADPGKDTTLTIYQITTLHNTLINQRENADTALISKTELLARKNANPYIKDFLISAAAYARYGSGQVGPAIRLLREAAYAGQQEKYFNALGLWAIEQNVPASSISYFDDALKQEFAPALFNRAIGLTEALRFKEATVAWGSLQNSSDTTVRNTALTMLRVLHASVEKSSLSKLSDEERYLFGRYFVTLSNTSEFETLVNSIDNPDWKVKSLLDRSRQLDEICESELATVIFGAVKGIPIRDKKLYQEILQQNLLFLARQKKYEELQQAMNDKQLSGGPSQCARVYIDALLSAQAGKNETAVKDFTWLLAANPFFEDGIIAAIDYLGKEDPKSLKLYSALVTALDLNPNSPKLLKLYAVMSFRLDFDETAQATMDRLKSDLSKPAFLEFLKEYPDLFEVTAH